jgi:tetratricopeptide (TPR) repeat protein
LKQNLKLPLFHIGLIYLGVFSLSFIPLQLFNLVTDANESHNIGYFYLQHNNYEKAQQYFEQTIKEDPNYAWAYGNFFLVQLASGKDEQAQENLRQLLMLRPDDLSNFGKINLLVEAKQLNPEQRRAKIDSLVHADAVREDYDPYAYEANRKMSYQKISSAKELFARSISTFDSPVGSLIQLAALKRKADDNNDARQLLQQAIDKEPMLLPARYNLANIYIQEKNYPQVILLLQPVYDLTPELGETWYSLITAYINNKNVEKVDTLARAYIRRYDDDESKKEKVDKLRSFLLEQQANNNLSNIQDQLPMAGSADEKR